MRRQELVLTVRFRFKSTSWKKIDEAVGGTKEDRCEVRFFYKKRVDVVRESDSPFREVNKEIYKVTNLGI